MGSLYLLRHGQASFGQTDYDALSPQGQEQARILGQALQQRGIRFHRALQGSMLRHQQTAKFCLAEMADAPPLQTDERWNEFDHQAIMKALHPDFENPEQVQAFLKSSKDPARAFHKEFEKAMQRWMSGTRDEDYTETWQQFKQRCADALQSLLKTADPSENILVFTSGGPISGLMGQSLELSDAAILRLNGAIVNASITRLPFKEHQLFVAFFNDYAHFEKTSSSLLTHR